MRLSIENGISSFDVLTGKQNANSATKRIFLNSCYIFRNCQVPSVPMPSSQIVCAEQFKKAIASEIKSCHSSITSAVSNPAFFRDF